MESDERRRKIVEVKTQEAEKKKEKKRLRPKNKLWRLIFLAVSSKKTCHGKKENALARSKPHGVTGCPSRLGVLSPPLLSILPAALAFFLFALTKIWQFLWRVVHTLKTLILTTYLPPIQSHASDTSKPICICSLIPTQEELEKRPRGSSPHMPIKIYKPPIFHHPRSPCSKV